MKQQKCEVAQSFYGCSMPARFRNPLYDPDGDGYFNYAKWLCGEHYDEVMGRIEAGTQIVPRSFFSKFYGRD